MALLSASQMAALQSWAQKAMTTPITIARHSDDASVYGDDAVTFTVVGTTNGWFHSTPTATVDIDSGSVVTANTYRLFVPVGTDILPHDEVRVGTETYVVTDTTAESTWQAQLHVSLRRRE